MIDLIDLLGQVFTLRDDGSFTRTKMEGDEGHGEYSHHVEAKSGLWQMNLEANGVVNTIFLNAEAKSSLPFGLKPSMVPRDVVALLGSPDKSGEEQEVEFLGRCGPWLRFERETMCIHAEFHAGTHLLKQVTVMLPEIAP
jgi:hypothetical protein